MHSILLHLHPMKKALRFFGYTFLCGTLLNVATSCGQSSVIKNNKPDSLTLLTPDFIFPPLSQGEIDYYGKAVNDYYRKNLLARGFNGSILVAKNGIIVYEDYHGYINFANKEPITVHSPFHLASISKTFTGMTVLKLWEEGRISLDDSLQKIFPAIALSWHYGKKCCLTIEAAYQTI